MKAPKELGQTFSIEEGEMERSAEQMMELSKVKLSV